MVWLFDATERFPCVPSGNRVFFSLERTKHIPFCQKKVFLDCVKYVVEVEHFTDLLAKFSGFGRLRDRDWFVATHLSECVKSHRRPTATTKKRLFADRWSSKQPWRLTDYPSKWRDPVSRTEVLLPAKTVYVPLDYKWSSHPSPVWSDVIANHPEIANGWSDAELRDMRSLLSGKPMILEGKLRLMPAPSKHMKVEQTVATISQWIARTEGHMDAGRIPIVKPETLQTLVTLAEQHEIKQYGQLLQPRERQDGETQKGLFD